MQLFCKCFKTVPHAFNQNCPVLVRVMWQIFSQKLLVPRHPAGKRSNYSKSLSYNLWLKGWLPSFFVYQIFFYTRGFWRLGNRVLHTLVRGLPQQQFKKTISQAVLASSIPLCQMCCEMTDPWPLWQGTLAAWWRMYTGPSSTAASSCTPPQVSVRNLTLKEEGNCILRCNKLKGTVAPVWVWLQGVWLERAKIVEEPLSVLKIFQSFFDF
jgi:hypothetical protein